MKRIRQAIARISRAGKSESELVAKPVSTASSTTVAASAHTARTAGRRSLEGDEDASGPLLLYDGTVNGGGDNGIDIVFIHSLNGGRIRSWQRNGICWPRDLLPQEIPNARIVTWGWAPPGMADFGAGDAPAEFGQRMGERLLKDVTSVCGKTDRDLVFVAHGVGGWLLQDALGTIATSQVFGKHSELGRLYPRTVGIVFLGTPHKSVGRQSFGEAVATVAQVETSASKEYFEGLASCSDAFEQSRDEFMLVSRDIQVVCVRGLLPMPNGETIPKASLAYEGLNVTVDDIMENHLKMARFATRQDPGYYQLVGHINTEAKIIRNQEILKALDFDMGIEEGPSDEAYRQTSSWLLSAKGSNESVSRFHAWLQAPGSIFWFSGTPASGKSTVMKYALHDPQTRELLQEWAGEHEVIVAAIFLNEGGSHVQTTVNLSQAFYQLFARKADSLRICLFIDGLDEYRLADQEGYAMEGSSSASCTTIGEDGQVSLGSSKWINDSHLEIARLITDLAEQEHFKLCVSSRELAPFKAAFRDYPGLRVHLQTQEFIVQYCRDRLDNVAPGISDSQVPLCQEVARKSRGDILWARLAMDILMEGSLKRLKSTLETLPTQLFGANGIYMRMVQDLAPHQQRAACRIIHIILKAQEPPSLVTLAFAEEGYLAGPKQQQKHPSVGELAIAHDRLQPMTLQDLGSIADRMERRLATCCAGLLEAREKDHRVVFMHLTAKEFIFKGDIWDKLNVTPPNKIEVYYSLMSGTLRYLRCLPLLRPIVTRGPKPKFTAEAWVCISSILRYAEQGSDESFDPVAYCELLDELDLTCHELWTQQGAAKGTDTAHHHWSSFEPMELGPSPRRKDFLALAIQANLFHYVSTKLARLDPAARRATAQYLLEYAVCPSEDSHGPSHSACMSRTGNYRDFHHHMPTSQLADLLFAYGATAMPTEDGSEETWARTVRLGPVFFPARGEAGLSLATTRELDHMREQDRRRWIKAVKGMLAHGADPRLQVDMRGGGRDGDDGWRGGGEDGGEENGRLGDRGSVKMQTALEAVRELLDGDRGFGQDLIEIEALACGLAM
ncbi:Uu.00g131800.m01.CDS01 [Anthostomella pinea]|uniref:Uu.00g131800.m01.CDS01 n=1 Tax=Anthostomella pinea TaxID=933095 RepID=A0AAI8VJP0_9PEZI|nr:Uu.00g131800.m01.CDS01 [Anthostomella pinea]